MGNNSITIKKSISLIGIFLSISLPLLAISSSLLLKDFTLTFETKFLISRFAQWSALLLLFLFVLRIEKRPFLLWKEQEHSFWNTTKAIILTLSSLILCMLVIGILLKVLHTKLQSDLLDKILAVLKTNFILLFFTSISAGIIEELIFRGYLLPRLEILFKNKILAIAVSSFLFGIMHFSYGTLSQTIGPMIIGIVLAVQYYKYKNIKILIFCHFLWDLVILLKKT